jgi:carbonic anhydrase
LTQFHLHHPGEETINGKHYDMVVHLVYQNKEGHYAVIAVLIKEGHPNPLIATLWNNLPPEMDKEHDSDAVQVNAIQLVPAKRSYYKYEGSLTTPPCTEGIVFFVLDTPMSLSKEQIATFAKYYPDNARPVQPLNGRTVQHSK